MSGRVQRRTEAQWDPGSVKRDVHFLDEATTETAKCLEAVLGIPRRLKWLPSTQTELLKQCEVYARGGMFLA